MIFNYHRRRLQDYEDFIAHHERRMRRRRRRAGRGRRGGTPPLQRTVLHHFTPDELRDIHNQVAGVVRQEEDDDDDEMTQTGGGVANIRCHGQHPFPVRIISPASRLQDPRPPPPVNCESYAGHIFNVLKQVHPNTGISSKAMSIMNTFVVKLMKIIATVAGRHARPTKTSPRSTITSLQIQTAVRILLPEELAKHAMPEASRAVLKYDASTKENTI
jgi:histone H2B